MKKQKGSLLQRMMAVLLSVVLVVGMVSNAAPINVLAQESVSENTPEPVEGETKPAQGEDSGEQKDPETAEGEEETNPEGQEQEEGTEQETPQPGNGAGEETPEPGMEEEKEQGTVSENDVPTETVSENDAEPELVEKPRRAMRAAQADKGWEIDANGMLIITSDDGMTDWIKNGKNANQTNLKKAEVQSGVTSIGNNAFSYCRKLASITIADSVTSIGNAFTSCMGLTEVILERKTPPSLSGNAFTGCKFHTSNQKGIHVPFGTAKVYQEAAGWSTYKKNITDGSIGFGNGWTLGQNGELTITSNEGMADWIENGRDAYKSNVISVDIQSNVTSIGDAAFTECQNLKNIMISESVESIGNSTFEGCSGLTEITIPKNVASIGNDAFIRCSSLAKVTMGGETPPNLGTDAFSGCLCVADNKQGIHVPEGKAQAYKTAWTDWADYITDGTESTDKGWTFENGKLTITSDAGMQDWKANGLSAYKSDVTSAEIQNGVTSILANAFDECSSLEKITIPASVTSIGNYAFYWCTGLEEIAIPEKVTSIGNYAFYNCPKLKGITIPASVTSIGGHAFQSCKGLESITISANVMSIGESAFSECLRLATVTMLGEPPRLGSNVFGAKGEATRVCGFITKNEKGIHVPAGKLQAYQAAWTEWVDYIVEDSASAEEHKHNDVTFTAWTGTTSLPNAAGNYYLTKDVTLPYKWEVPSGVTNLCLNGKTVSNSNNDLMDLRAIVIWINGSCTLNLYDCQNTGNITGGKNGGVYNAGTFHMHGGKISGNTAVGANGSGVAVGNGGIFHMYGGEISGNPADDPGGGVAVRFGGTFHMYGGKIDGNPGGGVYVRGTFEMDGGEISGNRANIVNLLGGGVYVDVAGTFAVGGSAVISGNTADGAASNVYLSNGRTITAASENPLSGSAKIGVTTYSAPTEGNPVNITGHNKGDYSSYFTSDNPAYEIVNANDVVQLAVKSQTHTHNLTLTPAKPATCTEDGNTAYYVCGGNNGCGKWFSDAEGTQEIKNHASVVILKTGHSYDESAWGYTGADGHAHKCRNCNEHDAVQAHTPGEAATETTPQICTVCGYIITPVIGHTCDPQPVEKKEPNCTTAGKEAYYHCEGCGKNYEDAEGSRLIADISAWGNIAALGHDWGEWTVTKSATATTPGEKERTCKRCDEKETETIPKTGGGSKPGGGDQDDNDHGDDGGNQDGGDNGGAGDSAGTGSGGGSDGSSGTPLSELADMVLTKEEKQKAADGTDIRIVLDVKDASAIVSAADKALVEAALNGSLAKGYTLGQYLDISLYKVIGNSRTSIKETAGKITVRIDVPERLRNTDRTKTRTFAVIRVHGGKAELLSDLDNNEDTITIATDRFSTYAVIYKDTADKNSVVRISVEDGSKKSDGAKDNEPKTGDNTPLELCATLSMIAGFAYLLLYFADRERGMTEETKKELVSRLVAWAKQGGRIRRYLALTAIFVLLVYYHSIGKKTCTEWKAIYGE